MLLNGIHLLPDLSGALICPRERLVAFSDPIGDPATRQAPLAAPEVLKRLISVLRQRRPAKVVWLGGALPTLLEQGALAKREADSLKALVEAHEWHWLKDGDELKLPGLTFRPVPQAGSGALGEVSAQPWPVARVDGASWPCFVIDGRRLVLPAFGARRDGVNVLSPAFQALFRRPFQALMLVNGRIVTRPRARLEPPPPPRGPEEPA